VGDSLWYNWPTYKDSVSNNWQDDVYKLAGMFSHNLSFTGGTANLKVAGSMSFSDQDGIARGTNYKKYTARVNTTANISKIISNSTSIGLTYQDRTGSSLTGTGGLAYSAVRGSPFRAPGQDLNQYLMANGIPIGGTDGVDPLVDLLQPDIKDLNYFASINSFFDLKLLEGLTLRIAGGVNYDASANNYFYGRNTSQAQLAQGLASKGNSTDVSLLNENTLNYTKSFGASNKLDAVLGFSFQNSTSTFTEVSTSNFAIEALGYNNLSLGSQVAPPSSGKSVSGIVSYFGRAQYAFLDKYILTGTLRADGSSKFPIHKWGYFPSGGFAWKIQEEKFMHSIKSISTLKLRFTYGLTGNESIPPYSTYTSYGSSRRGTIQNNTRVIGVVPSQIGSDQLKWETTIQKTAAIDLGLFNDRIVLSADFYMKNSKDLLLEAPLSAYSGFTTVTRNVGDIEVKGMEYNLNTVNLEGKFRWTTNFNIAFNKTKVLSLNENQTLFYAGEMGRYSNVYTVEVGKPLGSIYGYVYDGISNTQEELAVTPEHASISIKQGTRKYKDISGPNGKPDGIVDDNDRTVIGNGNPKFFGGFTNDFSYGSFDFSFLFTYNYGNDIINANKSYFFSPTPYQGGPISMFDRWTPEKPQINKQTWNLSYNGEYDNVTSYLVEDGSYLRLKNVQLAYNLNKNLLKNLPIKSLRVYVAAQNLLTLTHYTGYDPEVNYLNSIITPGADVGAYPRSKVYTFGLNIAF
jgi:TonB-linked SusC/RagA family outer membrane protein